jgi:DNA recombination protein RmuC
MEQTIIVSGVSALIAATLAYLIAYLFAKNRSAKSLAESQAQIDHLAEQLSKASDFISEKTLENRQLNEKLNAANQETTKLSGQFAYAQQSYDQEKERVQIFEQKLEAANQEKHEAEKANESAQTSLSETNKKVDALQSRLDKEEAITGTLRKELDVEKQKLSEQSRQSKDFEVQASKANEQVREKQHKLEELEVKLEEQRGRYDSLHSEHTKLQSTLDERQASHAREVDTFNKQKEELKKDFENLANKIFEEKGKTFTQTSQNSIDGMLKPFREQIEAFQKRVDTVHSESVKEGANLNAEIKKVLDVGMKMSADAHNLTSALKGDSQQRGAWGEAQLRRTLEMSGLIEEAHFEVQSSFKDADGKQKQTDYLIKLPGNKHIIIDSKVSMVAYDRAISAETPEAQTFAMNEHVKSVKKHIDDLSSKDYTNLVGMRSPDFVLMFMPIEPAYIDALKSNKDLFSYGYEKHIVLVSHTTLIPILRTVANLWVMENSNQEARELSEKAGEIYNQVCTVAERLSKLGGTLNTASTHYNNTVKALAGQQGLHGKVERFNKLSAKVSKSLPALEPAHMDFETERLSMIVEAIDEPIDEEIKITSKEQSLDDEDQLSEAPQIETDLPDSLTVEQETH